MNAINITLGVLSTILLGVIGSLIASFLYSPLWDRWVALLVRFFGWVPLRRPARFAGIWKSTWEVDSISYPSSMVDDKVEVRQLGRRIYAKMRANHFNFYLVGTVDAGRYITGTWFDETHGGYHGAFQFVVDPATGNFKGVWIGFSKTGAIKHGNWIWERQNDSSVSSTKDINIVQPSGPANGSQPIRSETNGAPSTANSHCWP